MPSKPVYQQPKEILREIQICYDLDNAPVPQLVSPLEGRKRNLNVKNKENS